MRKTTFFLKIKARWLNTEALLFLFIGIFLPVLNLQAQFTIDTTGAPGNF